LKAIVKKYNQEIDDDDSMFEIGERKLAWLTKFVEKKDYVLLF